MMLVLVAVAAGLVLIVLALERTVAVLDEAEATLRSLVSGVRAVRRAVRGAAALAGDVGSSAAAGEDALGHLEELKGKRRADKET